MALAFFDSAKVMAMVDAKRRRALSKFGAFVRRKARSSIRKRKKLSEPGSPPSSHVGTLKNLIYFAYDTSRNSVVVGPTPFRGKAVAPALLERGGSSSQRTKSGRARSTQYRARPFMKPAYEAELPKFLDLFRG